jgi:hypothetical protein
MANRGWIGVDLDGTIAYYDGWQGHAHIGAPIMPMVKRVREWLEHGREVRLFTARAGLPEQELKEFRIAWAEFCDAHIGQTIAVTNVKDFRMEVLYDDRAVTVEFNTGIPVELI